MAYRLQEFNGVTLPYHMPQDDLNVGAVSINSSPLSAGGAYDLNGTETTYARGFTLSHKAKLIDPGNRTQFIETFQALRAQVGQSGSLYRIWDDDTRDYVSARLINIQGSRAVEDRLHLDLTLNFQVFSRVWLAETATTNNATIDATPDTVTLNNAGDSDTTNVVITVTGTATPIEDITIAQSGLTEIKWEGSLGTGSSLVIDCGARSVKKDGADDYDNFSLTTNHAIGDWMRLSSGDNTVNVTINPAGALNVSMSFVYNGASR